MCPDGPVPTHAVDDPAAQGPDAPRDGMLNMMVKLGQCAQENLGETQSILAAPPQGDLASIGFEKAGITNQTEARNVGVGDRHGSVRNKRPL